jgi:type I restriction enzyme M protein
VILPLTVLRRLDCVLAPTKEKVLKRQGELRGKGLQDLDAQLRRVSGFAFYNTSRYDFEKLLADAPHVAANLRNYIAGFSPNMREVLEKFDFDNTISKLNEAGLLFKVLERFKNVDLHPDQVDNPTMGIIFEELIRKFNEALNENPGEHFTPRDVALGTMKNQTRALIGAPDRSWFMSPEPTDCISVVTTNCVVARLPADGMAITRLPGWVINTNLRTRAT